MRKIFTLVFLFASLWQVAMAQTKTITGTVTAADDNSTLPGVTVLVKGTTQGTVTDFDGNYILNDVPENSTLVFSFVGMKSIELPTQGKSVIDVSLESSVSELDELVVIGYGTVKKKDVTGSVSVVDSKTIDKLRPVKIEEALQGTMTGVNVTQQSGAPGAGLNIRIRGISTNGDASPVVIIDGYQGDLNTLNPDDVESITVLKDAQAAIYGTVGANGIILVTTKSGKRNTPTTVDFNVSGGLQQASRMLPVMNATEYAVILNESYAANGQDLPYPDISGLGKGTNWQDQLFSTEAITNSNIRVSGGSKNMNYAISASNLYQNGIIGGDKTGFRRKTAKVALGADFTKWLKFNTTLMYTHLERKSINDFGLGSVLFNAVNMPSTHPVYDENGDYFLAPSNLGIEIINPLAQIDNTFNEYFLNKLNGNAGLEAKFAKHFTATARIGFNTTNDRSKSFSKIVDYGGKVFDITRSSVNQGKNNYNDYTFDAFLTYQNSWSEIHNLTATLGTTVYKTWGNGLFATGWDVPNNSWDFADISLANGISTSKSNGSYTYDQRRLSYFLRAQYDYMGKYLLSAMIRRDASSKFGPDNSAAYFPSATFGWVVSKENFMQNASAIELLKVRVSYGLLGSDKIGDFQYISQLSGEGTYVLNNMLVYGTAVGALPNPGIKWEQSSQFDAGFDLKVLDGKFDITADYFDKTTKDLLIGNIPVSGILGVHAPGASGPTVNAGTVRNNGFEFSIGYHGGKTEKFNYTINYNVTALNNEVLEVNNGTGYVEGGSFGVGQPYPARMEVGLPIGYYYGYKTNGLFQTQEEADAAPSQIALGAAAQAGDIRFVDINGDGVINSDDRTNIGDPIPDFIMGLNLSMKYKNIDFVAYAFASIGNDLVRNYERTQPNVNRLTYYLDRWTGAGTSNEVPRVTTAATPNNVFSDFYVENGSYLRLQRLSIGYTLPGRLTDKIHVKKLRFYLAGDNLVTLTNYMGFDPAAASGAPIGNGFDAGFYPAAKVYWFGFNVNI